MNKNTCLLYDEENNVFQKLLEFCSHKGFKVKENNEKFYFIRARKGSIFFWKTLRLELEILLVEKKKVQVTAVLFKNGKRQAESEAEYIQAIEKIF